jgi:hypothetical protein
MNNSFSAMFVFLLVNDEQNYSRAGPVFMLITSSPTSADFYLAGQAPGRVLGQTANHDQFW